METDWKGSGKYVSMENKVTELEKTWNRCGEEKDGKRSEQDGNCHTPLWESL